MNISEFYDQVELTLTVRSEDFTCNVKDKWIAERSVYFCNSHPTVYGKTKNQNKKFQVSHITYVKMN